VNPYAFISALCGGGLAWVGNCREGELFLEKGLRHALNIGNMRTLGMIEFLYGNFCHTKDDWTMASSVPL